MPLCRDPYVAQLNALGFSALRTPRLDYVPGSLLAVRRGEPPVLFGGFADGFDGVSLPEPTEAAAGQMAKSATASYKKNVGLKIAAELLAVTPGRLDAALSGVKSMAFRFGGMRVLTVPLGAVAQAVPAAEPTSALCALDASRLFVIAEVLQAKEFYVWTDRDAASSMSSQAVGATVLDGSLEFDGSRTASGLLAFKGKEAHSIGFKAYELEIAGGEYRLASAGNLAGLSHLSAGDPEYRPTVFESPFL